MSIILFERWDSKLFFGYKKEKQDAIGILFLSGPEGQPVLTTKLSKEYIYSFRNDNTFFI